MTHVRTVRRLDQHPGQGYDRRWQPQIAEAAPATADYRTYRQLDPPVAYSSVSADGGRTWSRARPEPELHNAVSKAYFGRDASGRHVYVFSAGPQRERRGLYYRVRRPGEGWGEVRAFYDPGVKNSYPTLLEYAPGRFHCVWDSSDTPDRHRTVIRYGRLGVDA